MIPVFFLTTLLLVAWIYYQRARSTRRQKETEASFWEKENRANMTRKKDLSSLEYITVPIDTFSCAETSDEELSELFQKLTQLSFKKIVNFTGITNTELKLAYGAPNLPLLSEYDQNYTELVRTLYKYGSLLYQKQQTAAAKTVLEYALSIHTDVSANYTLLATIYKEENNFLGIDFVIEQAKKQTSMTKNALLASLTTIREEAAGGQ